MPKTIQLTEKEKLYKEFERRIADYNTQSRLARRLNIEPNKQYVDLFSQAIDTVNAFYVGTSDIMDEANFEKHILEIYRKALRMMDQADQLARQV